MSAVSYDGAQLSFILPFDNNVSVFDNDYAYVGVFGGNENVEDGVAHNYLSGWEDEWFAAADVNKTTVTKDGDADTRGTAKYVRTHVNDVIGKYVYLNGVSIRDIALAMLVREVPENPKAASNEFQSAYQKVWEKLGIRVSKEGNHINFFGLKTDDPFIASLLGCDADARTIAPLTVTVREGFTSMDGGAKVKQSVSATYQNGSWSSVEAVVAVDPTDNITVGGITSPTYNSAVLGKSCLYLSGEGTSFSVYFGEDAWYKQDVTKNYKTGYNWYWCVNAPAEIKSWVAGDGNGGGTTEAAVNAVMNTLGTSVRDKIVFSDVDGNNQQTLGAISDGQSGENNKYFQFNVLANIQANSLVFVMSKDIGVLGWNNGAIGRDFKITFKQGFATMTDKTIAEDISFIYRTATGVFERDGIVIPPLTPEQPITEPVTVSMQTFHDSGTSIGCNIDFSANIRPRDVGNVDVAAEDWVRDGFMLNGKTFGEIYDYAKAQSPALDFRVMFEKVNGLTVWVDKNIPESEGGLKKDADGSVASGGNKVVIKANISLPRSAQLAYSDDIAFENSGANWTRAYVFPDDVTFTPVEISGISNPMLYDVDAKVKYTVTFGADVASKQYFHVNAAVGWLLDVNKTGLNNLGEEEIKRLEYYGVYSSVVDKIVIGVNGVAKTVREWQKSDANPSNYNQGVLQIHYGQDGANNTLEILWASQRIPDGAITANEEQKLCPKLTDRISVTFKSGFRTPNMQEIAEDVTFTYSGEAGAHFIKESAGTVYETVTFTKVFYNGERIEENGTLTLPADTFTLDKNLFTVMFAEGDGITFTVDGAESLQAGNNTVTVTGTSGSASAGFTFTVVCSQKKAASSKKGCGSSAAGNLYVAALLLLCMSLSMLFIYRGKKA